MHYLYLLLFCYGTDPIRKSAAGIWLFSITNLITSVTLNLVGINGNSLLLKDKRLCIPSNFYKMMRHAVAILHSENSQNIERVAQILRPKFAAPSWINIYPSNKL